MAVPNVVIRFGAQPVSKPLMLYLKACKPNVFMAVDESPIFRDSLHIATHHVQVEAESLWIQIS